MTAPTLRCTDRAYDGLLAIYGTDRAVWAAVGAFMNMFSAEACADGEIALLALCRAHRINPDRK